VSAHEAARKIFKRFIIILRSSPSLAVPRDAAGPRGIPSSRGSQEQRAVSSVRASLTARPWHPGDRIRPLRVDHVISWKWKRARARVHRALRIASPHPRESPRSSSVVWYLHVNELRLCGIACRLTSQWRSVWKLWAAWYGHACSPCLFAELAPPILPNHGRCRISYVGACCTHTRALIRIHNSEINNPSPTPPP
jgi:hypothetical protein